jgi:hypothetical protein
MPSRAAGLVAVQFVRTGDLIRLPLSGLIAIAAKPFDQSLFQQFVKAMREIPKPEGIRRW